MNILYSIWCAIVKIINAITETALQTIIEVIASIISILPSIPIMFQPVEWGPFGNLVGYFIPISQMLGHFTLMLTLVAVWYTVQHILRLVRMIK